MNRAPIASSGWQIDGTCGLIIREAPEGERPPVVFVGTKTKMLNVSSTCHVQFLAACAERRAQMVKDPDKKFGDHRDRAISKRLDPNQGSMT
jgi:hypothetical protein